MKKILTTLVALTFAACSPALASENNCKPKGGGWSCPVGDTNYAISNATSAAEAYAAALAFANQSQSSENLNSNNNSVSSSNSNIIEGAPAHTTSMNLGVGINFSVPIASGVQTKNAIDTANWFMQHGQSCVALSIMAKAPRVRNLKINFNCGDKG